MSRINAYLARARSLQEFTEITPAQEQSQFVEEIVQAVRQLLSLEEHFARLTPDFVSPGRQELRASLLKILQKADPQKGIIIPEPSTTPQRHKSDEAPATS
jgi:hypothetical protein